MFGINKNQLETAIKNAITPINAKINDFEKRIKALEAKPSVSKEEIENLKKGFNSTIEAQKEFVKQFVVALFQENMPKPEKYNASNIDLVINENGFQAKIGEMVFEGKIKEVPKIEEKPKITEPKDCPKARERYLNENKDVANAGIDPWLHFNQNGKSEGREWHSELCN